MPSRTLLICAASVALAVTPSILNGQNRPYTEGSVWAITMVRTTAGMHDDYMRSLGTTWKRVLDEAKKQGLVLSYRVLSTDAAGADDWDVLLMVEYKNWAAFDGLGDKMEPIARSILGTEDQNRQLMTQRLEIRRTIGFKTARELLLK